MANRAGTSKSNWGKLVHKGMGGFLNPPTHPEHKWDVQSVYGDTFHMSLSAAAEATWLNDETRRQATSLLRNWKRPPIQSPEVQDWIRKVLGYCKGCYVGQDKQGNLSWNVSDLRIRPDIDPMLNENIHAGVHLIRKYYPDYMPTKTDFAQAYWGKKPEKARLVAKKAPKAKKRGVSKRRSSTGIREVRL